MDPGPRLSFRYCRGGEVSLLRVTLNLFCGDGDQVPKKALCSLLGASGEVDLRCRRLVRVEAVWCGAISGAHAPDAIDGEGLSGLILEQTVESAGCEIVGGDESGGLRVSTGGEVGDEQVVAEASKVERSKRHSPRCVEPIAMLETAEQLASRGIDINEAKAGTGSFKGVSGKVQSIGNDEVVSNGLYVEGHEVAGEMAVSERQVVIVVVIGEAIVVAAS